MKNISIPLITFFPSKINTARKEIEMVIKESLGEIESKAELEKNVKLKLSITKLIDQLNMIKSDKDIERFSRRLSDREIRLLLSYINLENNGSELELRSKILKICKLKPKEGFIKQIYDIFQTFFFDPDVIDTLKFYVQSYISAYTYLEIDEQDYGIIRDWLQTGANIGWLCDKLITSKDSFENMHKRLAIKKDKSLFMQLFWFCMIRSKSKIFFTDPYNLDLIYNIIQKTPSQERIFQFYNNYLNVLEIHHFDSKLIDILIDKFGEPNRPRISSFWNMFDENTKQKLVMWLNEQKLSLFFGDDNERFSFWKHFLQYMKYVFTDEQNCRAFMFFKNIVVIEFGKINNAIYAYDRKTFDDKFKYYMQQDKSNNFFKDKSLCLFRVNHYENWKNKAINYLRQYEEI